MQTTAIKQLTAMSLLTLKEAVSWTGALGYIEPLLQFVLHVPIRKRPVVRTEEVTRPIAMEEEIAKLVVIMIIAETEQYVSDEQGVPEREVSGRCGPHADDAARPHTRARQQRGYVQERPQQRVRHSGPGWSRALYLEAVGPGHTGIPSVWNNGVELAFDMEWCSDDAAVPAATEEALVAMLSQQGAVAPQFRVRHVPSKEAYLYITWASRAGATKAIRHAEYGKAERRDKRRGILVLGSQVLYEAAGTGLRCRVRGVVAEWVTATIHLAAI